MHDTSPVPGSVIGYRKDGREIRLQAGGSEAAVDAPPAPPAAPAAPPVPAPPAPAPEAPRVPPGQPDGGQFASTAPVPAAPVPAPPPAPPAIDWKARAEKAEADAAEKANALQRAVAERRKQESRSKANHAQVLGYEQFFQQVAEKLEIPFEDKPDPEEVNRKLTAAQAEARQLRVERAVYLTAAKSGADANALLDSRQFNTLTEQIDPDASDFADQVADLVRQAAEDSRYAIPAPAVPVPPVVPQAQPAAVQQPPAQPPATSSGADFSGAPGGNRLWTQTDYDRYMATSHTEDRDGKKLQAAIDAGLLTGLGVGRTKTKYRQR